MSERLSMRQAARQLGVSQIRVRELIRKGTLAAHRVADGGEERWEIEADSVEAYIQSRERDPERGVDASVEVTGEALVKLLDALEGQLGRVRELIGEIERSQAYLEGLRSARGGIERQLHSIRQKLAEAQQEASTAKH